MAKLPDPVTAGALSDHGQRLYDELAGPRGMVDGFYRTLLHNPELAGKVKDLGTFLRFGEAGPSVAEREIAILTAARVLDSRFIWTKHVPFAREGGLDERTLAALERLEFDDVDDPLWRAIAEAAAATTRCQPVPQSVQDTIADALGVPAALHLAACAAFYRFVAAMNAAYEVSLVGDGETGA